MKPQRSIHYLLQYHCISNVTLKVLDSHLPHIDLAIRFRGSDLAAVGGIGKTVMLLIFSHNLMQTPRSIRLPLFTTNAK